MVGQGPGAQRADDAWTRKEPAQRQGADGAEARVLGRSEGGAQQKVKQGGFTSASFDVQRLF